MISVFQILVLVLKYDVEMLAYVPIDASLNFPVDQYDDEIEFSQDDHVVVLKISMKVQSGGVIRIKILKIDFVFVRSHSLYVIEQ